MSLDVPVAPDITLTFGVPVMIHMVPGAAAFNDGLRRVILARESGDAGRSKSNAGGWHSDETLLSWPEPEIVALKGWIDDAVRKICRLPLGEKADALRLAYTARAWANVNRSGHYNVAHVHAGSHWSVVYYVAVGVEAPGHPYNGLLELKDPRPAAVFGRLPAFMFGRHLSIRPQPGMLVLFPAWIEHWVHPFVGSGERISIAVNIDVTRYDVGPGQ
jgi:uncharacterized protein (TIGR02466 family)